MPSRSTRRAAVAALLLLSASMVSACGGPATGADAGPDPITVDGGVRDAALPPTDAATPGEDSAPPSDAGAPPVDAAQGSACVPFATQLADHVPSGAQVFAVTLAAVDADNLVFDQPDGPRFTVPHAGVYGEVMDALPLEGTMTVQRDIRNFRALIDLGVEQIELHLSEQASAIASAGLSFSLGSEVCPSSDGCDIPNVHELDVTHGGGTDALSFGERLEVEAGSVWVGSAGSVEWPRSTRPECSGFLSGQTAVIIRRR